MEIAEKIVKLRKKYKLNQSEFASKIGVTQKTVSFWEQDRNIPDESNIVTICNIFDLPKDYFSDNVVNITSTTDCIPITYRPDVYLSAGYGTEVLEERAQTMLIDACLLVSEHGTRYNPEYCEVVKISGNSMSPEYRHGDRVIINKADTELMDGHIFAFRYNGQCYVKEINLMGDKVKCISLNKEYDPFYIDKDKDFKVFGRILPRIRL